MIILTAEWIPIVSLIMTCLGIPTLGGLIMTEIWRHKKANSEIAKQKKQQELEETMKRVIRIEVKDLKDDMVQHKIDFELIKQSLQATLRHELYEIADKWLEKGYCPLQDKEDFENIYKRYHALGKNGVMDDIYVKIMELPVSKPRAKKRTTHARAS